jgi:hypothetical protein
MVGTKQTSLRTHIRTERTREVYVGDDDVVQFTANKDELSQLTAGFGSRPVSAFCFPFRHWRQARAAHKAYTGSEPFIVPDMEKPPALSSEWVTSVPEESLA